MIVMHYEWWKRDSRPHKLEWEVMAGVPVNDVDQKAKRDGPYMFPIFERIYVLDRCELTLYAEKHLKGDATTIEHSNRYTSGYRHQFESYKCRCFG